MIASAQALIPEDFHSELVTLPNASNNASSSVAEVSVPCDALATSLLHLLVTVLSCLARNSPVLNSSEASAERMLSSGRDAFSSRSNDVVRLAKRWNIFNIFISLEFGSCLPIILFF